MNELLEELDECDIALINALQLNPRASWSLIGRTIGASATTAARRWTALSEQGIAWVTAYGHTATWQEACLAFVEVTCESAATSDVARSLAADPCAVTIEMTGDARCLLVTVTTSSVSILSGYVRNRIANLAGVISTRVHLATRVYAESASWQMRALSATQRRTIKSALDLPVDQVPIDDGDRPLVLALGADGRRTATELADDLGISPGRVRRQLNAMLRRGVVQFRCEVAQSFTPWPIKVIYLASCPPADLDAVGKTLATSPDMRVCVALMGADNILFSVWLSKPASSISLEIDLARRLPQLVITNRMVALHSVKRMGRLLDDAGRAVGIVPMDLWNVPGAAGER